MKITPLYDEKFLLQQVSQGDEKAFTQLFNTYRNKIYTVAYKLTASEHNAEEIVQDVFMKVWAKRASLHEVANFDAWLFIITRNTVFSFLRSKAADKLHVPVSDTEFHGIVDDAGLPLQEKEYYRLLHEAIERLPVQQKMVYHLKKDENLSHAAIAEQLGLAQDTVKKHLQYAMRSIRAYLLSRMDLHVLMLIIWKIS